MPQHTSKAPDHVPNVMQAALNIILSMLPLYAEEGGWRDEISEITLVDALVSQSISPETAAALVYTLRRQFEALTLLDRIALRKGDWAFASFPASLLGRSWLATLATPSQTLFPSSYWMPDASEPDKEAQRILLHGIETNRVRQNSDAQPIRFVHVAWAFIRIGNKFLMHHREDKQRPGEKSYGLVGGRFNLHDVPVEVSSTPDILKKIFRCDSEIVAAHISRTLEREIKEETVLEAHKHYNYQDFANPLTPYLEVNGASNKHAYTAYRFYLYHIKLTHAGETHLLAQISQNPKLKWFTADEIAAEQRANGDSAYVAALHKAWGGKTALLKQLEKVPESGSAPVFMGESKMLDMPGAPDAAFQLGKPGKEKSVQLTDSLEETEWQLLMLLAWHARDFPIGMLDAKVRLLGNGWIELPSLIALAYSLHQKIEPALPGLLEIREKRYASLRISPGSLFFSAGLFHYGINQNNNFRLQRQSVDTPWGQLQGDSYVKETISNVMVTALRELRAGQEPDSDWQRNLGGQLGEGISAIGLRRLWRIKGKQPSLVVTECSGS